jgi:ABC-type antimicrobial peptide transport system permease subunit
MNTIKGILILVGLLIVISLGSWLANLLSKIVVIKFSTYIFIIILIFVVGMLIYQFIWAIKKPKKYLKK